MVPFVREAGFLLGFMCPTCYSRQQYSSEAKERKQVRKTQDSHFPRPHTHTWNSQSSIYREKVSSGVCVFCAHCAVPGLGLGLKLKTKTRTKKQNRKNRLKLTYYKAVIYIWHQSPISLSLFTFLIIQVAFKKYSTRKTKILPEFSVVIHGEIGYRWLNLLCLANLFVFPLIHFKWLLCGAIETSLFQTYQPEVLFIGMAVQSKSKHCWS